MKSIKVAIRGVSPIMFNKVPQHVLLGIVTGAKEAKSLKKSNDVQTIAREHLYLYGNEDHEYIGIPLKNVFSCLVAAGTQIRLDGKRQLSTKDSSLLPGVMQLYGDDIENPIDEPHVKLRRPIDGKLPEQWAINRSDWVVNIQRGVNPNGKEMVAICRPLIGEWGFNLTVHVDDSFMQLDRYRELFDEAGNKFGLCEYRPQRKGFFGRFKVDQWLVQD